MCQVNYNMHRILLKRAVLLQTSHFDWISFNRMENDVIYFITDFKKDEVINSKTMYDCNFTCARLKWQTTLCETEMIYNRL